MGVAAIGTSINRIGFDKVEVRHQFITRRENAHWGIICDRLLTSRAERCFNCSGSTSTSKTNRPRKRGQKRRKRRDPGAKPCNEQHRGPHTKDDVERTGKIESNEYVWQPNVQTSEKGWDKESSPSSSDFKSPTRSEVSAKDDAAAVDSLDYESWDELRENYIDLDLADIDGRGMRNGRASEDAYLDDYAMYLNSLPTKSSEWFVWRYLSNHTPEVLVCALFTFCGYAVGRYFDIQVEWSLMEKETVCSAIGMLVGLTLGKYGVFLARESISRVLAQPRETLIARAIGSLMGILACLLAVYPFISNRNKAYETDPELRDTLYALLGFLIYNTIRVAVDVADKSLPEFIRMTIGVMKEEEQAGRGSYWLSSVVSNLEEDDEYSKSSVIDTSALIDGQLAGIASVGFLDGDLVIPGEVLSELQAMAGAVGQPSRQLRGRRGLDAIQSLKAVARDRIRISPSKVSYESSAVPGRMVDAWKDVDGEILRLALEKGATLVTCDFGLQERALKAGLKMVFNPRELAAAMSNSVVPGQRLAVRLVGPGLKKGQARAISADHYALQIIVVDLDIDFPLRGILAGVIVLATTQSGGGTTAFVRLDAEPWSSKSSSHQ